MQIEKRIQLKPRLHISEIGKFRFWTGIALGIFHGLILYSFIFYFLEIVSVLKVGMFKDISFQSEEALYFEHTFLVALAVTIGNHTMIRYWFSQPTFHFYKTRRQISLRILNYSLFIEYMSWYMIIVFLRDVFSSQIIVGAAIYDFYEELFYIVPVYLFLTSWTEVSRFFIVWKWKLYTLGISLFCIISLSFINLSSFSYAETEYKKIYEEELFYMQHQLETAEKTHEITYSDATITTLKTIESGELQKLLLATKQKFETNEKIALKDIILQKILIHNFKSANFEGYGIQYYPDPIDVYSQLKKVTPKSAEATELLNILDEFYQFTFFMDERRQLENPSITLRNKNNILPFVQNSYKIDHYRHFLDMKAQIFVIQYALLKQVTYEHPFVEHAKNLELPPPPLADENIYKRFPELKITTEQ